MKAGCVTFSGKNNIFFTKMTETIKFILNGQLREVSGLPPTTTLLQYLREQARLTGTKEGCAEGDCGACTVAVGRLQENDVVFKSLNACIAFLPTLDGREIITVEHLKRGEALSPVQETMVHCHGSQCGFCTPGFVMALSTLMHNNDNADDEDIQDAIAGNLCRCTGYRPILDAARQANMSRQRKFECDIDALRKIQRHEMFRYEAPGGKFIAPVSLEELAGALQEYPDATLLAGGTDVGLWVTKMHKHLGVIIYTGNTAALRGIKETGAGIEIGAAVTYTDAFEALVSYDPGLRDFYRRFASLHIRNAGTVGGNIANGSPIGDGMPVMIAMRAEIVLRSARGVRQLPLERYFLAYKKQDRRPDEFLEKIIIPKRPENTAFRAYKVSKRFDQDISAVCGAFSLEVKEGKVSAACFAYGGMAATPKRAEGAEAALIGNEWNLENVKKAMAEMTQDFAPLSDMRASSEYRLTVARNLLHRFYLETVTPDVKTQVYRYAE